MGQLCSGDISPPAMLDIILNSGEYKIKKGVRSVFPTGHFHSPVVDPTTVVAYVDRELRLMPSDIPGITLDVTAMRALWLANITFIQGTPFRDEKTTENRYSYVGGPFPPGDAIVLRMMMASCRPRRIVEIGSGFSSACMLDSAEHIGIPDFKLICIEPNPARLKSLLREDDFRRVSIIENFVQDVPIDMVDSLERNDILFIDSTHVMKTGSDVHHEFFNLLPRLKPGVIIHFHDIMYPFEYPRKWIFEDNYSWNEAYILRSFLMYNEEFSVLFWNSLFARQFRKEIHREFPPFLRNPGGSIWLQRL
jgi:predicted O-methyltransferase YrrM